MKMVNSADCLVEDIGERAGLKGSRSNDIVIDNFLIPINHMLDARLTNGCGLWDPGLGGSGVVIFANYLLLHFRSSTLLAPLWELRKGL